MKMKLIERLRILINDLREDQMFLLGLIEDLLDVPEESYDELIEARNRISCNNVMILRFVLALYEAEDTSFENEDQVYDWLNETVLNSQVRKIRVGVNSEKVSKLFGSKE